MKSLSHFLKTLQHRSTLGVLTIALLTSTIATTQAQTPELFEDKILLSNISSPWGFTFIDKEEIIYTERQGKLFRFNMSTNTKTEISGVPSVAQVGQGGLLDVALHPNFSNNNYVYLTYAVAATGGQTTALGRGTLVNNELQNFTELFRALPVVNSGVHFGSRIVFDRNNLIYLSVGDRGTPDNAQNKNNHLGKVLRLNDDGTVPSDNPLVSVPNTKPEIYCWGNRNIQGMAMHPVSGEIYAHEHGPRGGDELNLIKPNTNYGWPEVTFGINYDGTPITPDTTLPGMVLPLTYWVPSIAPSGLTFLKNGQADNEADILIGALAGTHVHWLKMKDDKKVSASRSLNGYARFRDIRQAPDGKIYALTESPNRFVLLKSNVDVFASIDGYKTVETERSEIYPNPLEHGSILRINNTQNHRLNIRILDIQGKEIQSVFGGNSPVGISTIPLNTEYLKSGLYVIEIDRSGKKEYMKVSKD